MTDGQRRVADLVRTAFRGVTLGNGIGLLQGQGLDDYADSETLRAYRSKDEKEDWSLISAVDLNGCSSCLSFFDAEGMRFHLPAYLIAHLEGTLSQDIVFHLVCFEHDAASRFAALNEAQCNAVREFLLLCVSERNCEFERPMIEKALNEYWTAPDGTEHGGRS